MSGKFKPLAVVVEGFRIEDIIDPAFKEAIRQIYGENYEIRFATLDVVLLKKKKIEKIREAKEKVKNKEKVKVELVVGPAPKISLRHRGEKDYADRRVIVESDENILELFLNNIDDILINRSVKK